MIKHLLVGLALVGSTGCGASTDFSASAFSVSIEACDGGVDGFATAVAVGPTTLASAGHPFELFSDLTVTDAGGVSHDAVLIYLDLDKDISLIELASTASDFLSIGEPETGAPVELLTFRNGEFQPRDATIVRKLDISIDGEGDRRGLELRAGIEPGDSGAGVVIDGSLVGVVFGADPVDPNHGWAVSSEEIAEALRLNGEGRTLTPERSCVPTAAPTR